MYKPDKASIKGNPTAISAKCEIQIVNNIAI